LVQINKAYKVLTDDEARKIFDEFGHPDGKQAMSLGIALPKWLVEAQNNLLVLFVYGSVFGIGLPVYVARWWYNAKTASGNKIQHATMAKFYKELKDITPFRGMVDLVCRANEIVTAIPYRKSETAELEKIGEQVAAELAKLGDKFDPKKKVTTLEAAVTRKVTTLLLAHLTRVPVTDAALAEEQSIIIEKTAFVAPGLLQIASARFWLKAALNAIDLRQRQISTIRQLLELSPEEQNEVLKPLTEEQREETLSVAEQYPLLRVRKMHLSVIGEDAITPGSIVTLVVKIELITVAELRRERVEGHLPLEEGPEEEPKKAVWFDRQREAAAAAALTAPAHAPAFPSDRTPAWWVLLGDPTAGRLICLGKVSDLGQPGAPARTARLQFQAPPRPGEWNFQVFVKSDSCLGCDATVPVHLTVAQPPPPVADADDDDDISEPDEDTIAGQMQALRTGRPLGGGGGGGGQRGPRGENDDSSDSDDGSYEEEEDDD
ncbi:secretory subunit, partial [Cladochytrium tenue]